MYRDRLTELKGNYNYNQVDNRSNNYGNSRNNGYSPVNGNGSPPDSPPRNRGGNDVASQYAGTVSTILLIIQQRIFQRILLCMYKMKVIS